MKRVICLYRVSTTGQVDHDDIPMQRLACREYVSSHKDWEIIDEISEKGVSGYKVSTNSRDAIVEIKKRAVKRQFDVLLVFMFDRLGRREDETPFVVQWFVQQGIEVWSTREGEQRFDTHVDKLLNYIRFWQASGESEKTAIRVRTKHSQMVQEGQYRGGLVPYGYCLEHQGRTNKKNQPVRDIVIDESEATVIRQIYHLLIDRGYGTNRVANYLNDRGITTKKGTNLWRGTSIRAIIGNPIYKGVMRFGNERSDTIESLRIIDDAMFERCLQIVKGRASASHEDTSGVPIHTKSRSILTGFLFCAHCHTRLCYTHNVTKRTLANGTIKAYERDLYRCYRKISARKACDGPSSYDMKAIDPVVEEEVRKLLSLLASTPQGELLGQAAARNEEMLKQAYKQAEKNYENIVKQLSALEDEAVKAITGESQIDLSFINAMLVKHRARLDVNTRALEQAKEKLESERQHSRAANANICELLSWGACFDHANTETKHMILSRLIDRVEVGSGYKIQIHFKVAYEQFIEKTA
jgi:DNA invertase Pin-like site-specific DNA recombinase